MIFKINKREFLDSLTTAVKAISNTTPLPILNGIKLIAENNTLTLISSDTNISIKTVIKNNEDKEIGNEFGKRDHSTVINACEKVEKLCKSDSAYLKAITDIKTRIS